MFIFSNLLLAIARILDIGLTIYMWIIIIAAIISWVSPNPYNPIVRFLSALTEPVLWPIRRRIGVRIGIDISPMIVILVIIFVKYFLVQSLIELAYKLKGGGII